MERDVLQLAAKGMRNKAIAEKRNVSVRTIAGHFTGILSKLRASSRVEAVLYATSHHLLETAGEIAGVAAA